MSDDPRVRGRLDALGDPASDVDDPDATLACLRCGTPVESLGHLELRAPG